MRGPGPCSELGDYFFSLTFKLQFVSRFSIITIFQWLWFIRNFMNNCIKHYIIIITWYYSPLSARGCQPSAVLASTCSETEAIFHPISSGDTLWNPPAVFYFLEPISATNQLTINLLSFIPIISNNKNIFTIEAPLKYFLSIYPNFSCTP